MSAQLPPTGGPPPLPREPSANLSSPPELDLARDPTPLPQPPADRAKDPCKEEVPSGARLPLEDLALLVLVSAALIVPTWITEPAPGRPQLEGVVEAPRRIDLNRSAWYEWTLLPGIGEARARRIVQLREERGGFRSLEELEELPGLPRGWTEEIRPFVTLEEAPAEPEREGVIPRAISP